MNKTIKYLKHNLPTKNVISAKEAGCDAQASVCYVKMSVI